MSARFWMPALIAVLALGIGIGWWAGQRAPAVEGEEESSRRIVSLGGSITEILYQLGVGPDIVGTDTTSTYPAAAVDLPKVGYLRQLSAEGVLSLRPTLVVGTADAGPPHVVEQLRAAGVEMVLLPVEKSPQGLDQLISDVATAVNAPDRVAALQQEAHRHWKEMEANVAGMPAKPRLLFIYARGGGVLNVSGTGTAADAVLQLIGGENAVTSYSGYKPLTSEALVEAKPGVIVMSEQGLESLGGEEALWKIPGMDLTPAAQAKRVVTASELPLLGFGLRTPETLADLSKALYFRDGQTASDEASGCPYAAAHSES